MSVHHAARSRVLAPEGTKFSWRSTFHRMGRLLTLVRPYRGKAILSARRAARRHRHRPARAARVEARDRPRHRPRRPRRSSSSGRVAFVVAALLGWGASVAQTYLSAWVGQRVLADLRRDLFAHIQTLELGYFERNRAGWLISRLTNDVDALEDLVTDGLYSSVQNTLLAVRHGGRAALSRLAPGAGDARRCSR